MELISIAEESKKWGGRSRHNETRDEKRNAEGKEDLAIGSSTQRKQ